MWCRHCKQDVPAVAPAADGAIHCARCQATLDRPAFASAVSDTGVGLDAESKQVFDPRRELEQGDRAFRREDIRRSIRTAQRQASPSPKLLRFDAPQPVTEHIAIQQPPEALPAAEEPQPPARQHRSTQWVAWMSALMGAMGLGAGLGMMLWSITGPMPELWNWGLGATLGGQGLMIIGLIQLLTSLWNVNRETAGTLRSVQHELRRLGRTTESLVGANAPTASHFYADLARGASPQLLLSNLKSQVDALTKHVVRK